ncbi:MAG: alpha-L-rhamnosidase C-terminal domain-containing protein [Terriglobia bacterium]
MLSGNLEAWFYQTLGGINYDPERPGFHHIILHPHPVADLTFVKASYHSLYGLIDSQWHIKGGNFKWEISIPPNTTATVSIPTQSPQTVREGALPAERSPGVKFLRFEDGLAVYEIGSGNYSFQSPKFVPL